MYGELTRDRKGNPVVDANQQVSLYIPTTYEKARISQVLKDYQYGLLTMRRTRLEFNDRSVQDEINENRKAFNSYIPPRSSDPDESWRAQTVRPITRNKLISIAAHMTAKMLYPGTFAVNDEDEEDRAAAEVMKDLMEWVIDNSEYSRQFIQAVVTALVEPCVIVHAEFAEVMRKVKEMKEDGTWTQKEILDEVLSGFITNVVPADELFIANPYEPNIQKQRFLVRNRFIDYEEAKQIYGHYENWKHVRPGIVTIYDQATASFYQKYDPELRGYLVNETIYYNRAEDLELFFVNGVMMTDADKPNPRKDKLYPFAKSGYEPINNGRFFYYKSAAAKLGSDQELVDTLYNMILDGTFLQLMPPMALMGGEDVNSSVMVPGTITSFRDPDAKLESIAPKTDLRAGLETIALVERSISESSVDNLQQGLLGGSSRRTAREIMMINQNAQTSFGLFGRMVGFLVEDIGHLMMGDILQHMTVAEVDMISGKDRYKSFLLPNKMIGGKRVTKKIQFTDKFVGKDTMMPDELRNERMKLVNDMGGPDSEKAIYKVNPDIFRTIKYKITVNPDELVEKSEAVEKALALEAYDRLIQNPVVDQEAVTRDFLLDVLKPGESSKYMKKEGPAMPPGMPGQQNQPGQPIQQKGVNGNIVGQLTGSNNLSNSLSMNQ